MAQVVNVNFRMDKDLKKSMEKTCSDMGMSMTTAFTIFAKTVTKMCIRDSPSTDHHALCNWNCISRENDFTCTGILSRNSNILSRRITAYHCCFINDPWCDHCSKFT